jgi:hypothetical protein
MSINVSVSNNRGINAKISSGNEQKVSSSTIFLGASNALDEANLALSTANTAIYEVTGLANGSIALAIVDAGTY